MKRRLSLVFSSGLFAVLAIAVSGQLGAAQEAPPDPTAGVRIAEGLAGSIGSTVGPDGALYVPEAGTGSVSRIDPATGSKTVAAEGLPHTEEGGGPVDAVWVGLNLYVLTTGVGEGTSAPDGVVGIYRVNQDGSLTVVADLGQYALDHPVDFPDAAPTGNPFAIDALSYSELVVTDGNHNRVLKVNLLTDEISEIAAYDNVVPTGLEPGNGNLLISEIGAFPHVPETGRVMNIDIISGETWEVAGGVSYIIDVEQGPSNRLYALSFGDPPTDPEGPPATPFSGKLLLVNGDGTFSTLVEGLMMPTSVDIVGDTALIVTLTGDVWRIDNVSALAPR